MEQAQYLNQVLDMTEAALAPKSNVVALTIPGQNLIERLEANQCVCQNCGVALIGHYHRHNFNSPIYVTCDNLCITSYGDPATAFCQQDFEDGLPDASVDDWHWIKRKYPRLAAVAERNEQ